MMERQTVTVEEAARILGISRSTAYLAVHRGELPVLRVGRRLLVSRIALERMLIQSGERSLPAAFLSRVE